jgi:hypothetical protein
VKTPKDFARPSWNRVHNPDVLIFLLVLLPLHLFQSFLVLPHWTIIGVAYLNKNKTCSTLANSTLIILFSEMLKCSKIISPKSKNIVKDNSEYFKIFHLLK